MGSGMPTLTLKYLGSSVASLCFQSPHERLVDVFTLKAAEEGAPACSRCIAVSMGKILCHNR
jgi:hypothetical protein